VTTPTTPAAQTIQHPQFLLRGKARIRELAVAQEVERQAVAADLERDLGRPASAAERLLIESIASHTVEARKLGKSSAEARLRLSRDLQRLGGGRRGMRADGLIAAILQAVVADDLFAADIDR
jgi:hypothetical protein